MLLLECLAFFKDISTYAVRQPLSDFDVRRFKRRWRIQKRELLHVVMHLMLMAFYKQSTKIPRASVFSCDFRHAAKW